MIDYKTGKPKRSSFYAKNKESAKEVLQKEIYKSRFLQVNDNCIGLH